MPLADESGLLQEGPHIGKRYHLSVYVQANRRMVQVRGELDNTAHIFPSLLLAVDYIERDLAAPGSVGLSSGIR